MTAVEVPAGPDPARPHEVGPGLRELLRRPSRPRGVVRWGGTLTARNRLVQASGRRPIPLVTHAPRRGWPLRLARSSVLRVVEGAHSLTADAVAVPVELAAVPGVAAVHRRGAGRPGGIAVREV